MKRKSLFKIALWTFSIAIVLFGVLIVHIAIVTNPQDKAHYGVQLGRIDFEQALDDTQVAEVNAYMQSIEGVGQTRYNVTYHNIVFAYRSELTDAQSVYDGVMDKFSLPAQRYIPPSSTAAAKCPVIQQKGLLKSLARQVQIHLL